jgi:hypothetical protein
VSGCEVARQGIIKMLNQFSDQQLIDELAHRERKRKPRANKPVDNPDFSQVVDLCKEYLEEIEENRYAL